MTNARALLLVGSAAHLASLLLPFGGFKCDLSPDHCAISGLEYVLLVFIWPSFRVALFAATCAWLASVLIVIAHAASGRLRRIGGLASLLLAPSFAAFVALMPRHARWVGQACAGCGALLVLGGALRARRRFATDDDLA